MEKALRRFLAWFSFALGVAQLAAPGRVNELIGVKDDDGTRRWQRIVGAQEVSAFTGVLTVPRVFLWVRVAGDVFHLDLLTAAWRSKRKDDTRLGAAIGNVAAILALDAFAAARHSAEGGPAVVAMTISRPREEVQNEWRQAGIDVPVSFTEAPGGRGTEVRIEVSPAARKPQAKDELRRFKQQLETGTVVASDGSPGGQETKRLFKQRPAQPVEQS